MITPLKLKLPSSVSLPVTINVPWPVGSPGPSVRSPSTKVNTPSGLLAPIPAVLARAAAPLVKYRPWLIAACFIPSLPYKKVLALATFLRMMECCRCQEPSDRLASHSDHCRYNYFRPHYTHRLRCWSRCNQDY